MRRLKEFAKAIILFEDNQVTNEFLQDKFDLLNEEERAIALTLTSCCTSVVVQLQIAALKL